MSDFDNYMDAMGRLEDENATLRQTEAAMRRRLEEVVADAEALRSRLAEADALLLDTKRDLRIAAKCMNPYTPVHRQFNETAYRIDAYLSRNEGET